MNWNSISIKKHNLLLSGVCACPGTAFGRIFIWGCDAENNFENGDILLFIDLPLEMPLWAIQKCSAIISCKHTSYSHLTSFAMVFNKPCIVGAIFNYMPKNYSSVIINSWENVVIYSELDGSHNLLSSKNENKWFTDIIDKVHERLYSKHDKVLVHALNLRGSEFYLDYVSGIFFDSTIFQQRFHSISNLKSIIHKIHCCHPSIEIYYRFSPNVIDCKNHATSVDQEIEFVCSLQSHDIPVCVFIANTLSYSDIIKFRQFVFHACQSTTPIRIGTMIENKTIVDCLEPIVADDLIDFAVIGINDLMSSVLNLERDNPKNQDNFRMDAKPVANTLITISNALAKKRIPYYIGFPKYYKFSDDYELLNSFGYRNYFTTPSLFIATYNSGGHEQNGSK